jgi:hypothetical protein
MSTSRRIKGARGLGTWFHVTERKHVPEIIAHGFVPGGMSAGNGTYLWKEIGLANDWLENHRYEDPVVLIVRTELKPAYIRKLYQDRGDPEADQYWGQYIVQHEGLWAPERVYLHPDFEEQGPRPNSSKSRLDDRPRTWRLDRVLFHETLVENEESIRRHGLLPQAGAVMQSLDCPSDDEGNPICSPPDLVFAADFDDLHFPCGLLQWRMVQSTGRPIEEIGDDEVIANTLLVIVLRSAFRHATRKDWDSGSLPFGVEVGDWYTDQPVAPLALLSGWRLLEFVERWLPWLGVEGPEDIRANPRSASPEMVDVLDEHGRRQRVPLAEARDQFAWHKKPADWSGAPCPVCGCPAKRLKAWHRALRAGEPRVPGSFWVKSVKTCFGTDSSIEPLFG